MLKNLLKIIYICNLQSKHKCAGRFTKVEGTKILNLLFLFKILPKYSVWIWRVRLFPGHLKQCRMGSSNLHKLAIGLCAELGRWDSHLCAFCHEPPRQLPHWVGEAGEGAPTGQHVGLAALVAGHQGVHLTLNLVVDFKEFFKCFSSNFYEVY